MTYGNDQYGWSPQPPPPNFYPVPQNNGLAVAALITGLLGFLCLIPAVAAIGLGVAGLAESRRTGVGRGMSISGICLGVGWIVIGVGFLVTVIALVPSN